MGQCTQGKESTRPTSQQDDSEEPVDAFSSCSTADPSVVSGDNQSQFFSSLAIAGILHAADAPGGSTALFEDNLHDEEKTASPSSSDLSPHETAGNSPPPTPRTAKRHRKLMAWKKGVAENRPAAAALRIDTVCCRESRPREEAALCADSSSLPENGMLKDAWLQMATAPKDALRCSGASAPAEKLQPSKSEMRPFQLLELLQHCEPNGDKGSTHQTTLFATQAMSAFHEQQSSRGTSAPSA